MYMYMYVCTCTLVIWLILTKIHTCMSGPLTLDFSCSRLYGVACVQALYLVYRHVIHTYIHTYIHTCIGISCFYGIIFQTALLADAMCNCAAEITLEPCAEQAHSILPYQYPQAVTCYSTALSGLTKECLLLMMERVSVWVHVC